MAAKRSKGLGRGLDALLTHNEEDDRASLHELAIDALQPGKYQPRTRMDPGAIDELAASIAARGIMQPIVVRPVGDGSRYEIIAGERRWRAARQAGLTTVPCLLREIPDDVLRPVVLLFLHAPRTRDQAEEDGRTARCYRRRNGRTGRPV